MITFEDALRLIPEQTILCVGDLMLDNFVYGGVSRVSPEAPAPVLAVTREEKVIGGAGNVARNIASLGARCVFVGVRGADDAGELVHAGFDEFHPGIEPHLIVDALASNDTQAALRLRALFDASVARRLGSREPGQQQHRGSGHRRGARRVAERERGRALRLCQGRAHAACCSRGDRGGARGRASR